MTKIIGKEVELGVAIDNAPTRWLRKTSANLRTRVGHVEDDTTRGTIAEGMGRRVTSKWFEGDIEGIVHADAVGYFLYNIYGEVSTGAENDGTYEHTFTLEESAYHEPLTLYLKKGTQEVKGADAVIGSWEISAEVDDYVRFTGNVVGKELAEDTVTPSYAEELDFIGKDIKVEMGEDIDSNPDEIKVRSITVSKDMDLKREHVLGQYTPESIYSPKQAIEITIERSWEDDDSTFEDLYTGDGSKEMRITIEGATDISDTSSNVKPKLEFEFYRVQVADWDTDDPSDELVPETVTLRAFYDKTEGQSEATLVNNTSSYESAS